MQSTYGFPEWMTAVRLRDKAKLTSMMKYVYSNDPWKTVSAPSATV